MLGKGYDSVAIAIVQTKGGGTGSGTSMALTWDNNTTTGNLIVVMIGTTAAFTSIVDSQSNTYTLVHANGPGTVNYRMYYVQNIIGGVTPTITVNMSLGQGNFIAREYSGILATSDPFDDEFSDLNSGIDNPALVGPAVNTSVPCLAVSGIYSGTNPSVGSGWQNYVEQLEAGSTVYTAMQNKFLTSVTSTTSEFNGTTGNWGSGIATFKADVQSSKIVTNILRPHVFSPGLAR